LSSEENLLEVFNQFREAILQNDAETLSELIADDYIGFGPAGDKQNKGISIEAYQPGGVDLKKYEVEGMEVRMVGELGIITGEGYLAGTFGGAEFEDRLRFIDIYINRGGRWQLYMSQATPLKGHDTLG